MIEKEKKKMQNKETETFIKIQEQTSLISELKKQIRMLKNIEIDNKISSSINDMTQHNLRATKSQLELNSKISETVLYAPQDDNSIIEPLNKQYHKRRPSSLSSAERVFRARYQDYSPKYDYPSNMDESYVSKGYGDDINQTHCLDDFNPEREIDSFHNQREIKQLSMSYLEEDYEDHEYISKTQRDSRTNSRQPKKEMPYKPSPIAIATISSKNFNM
jgi:polyhydroxyalkanoate synthesis regulator phasin